MKFTTTALPGVTLLNAPVAEHRFDKHVHDTYSFGITLTGVQAFSCRGSRYANTPGSVIAFNPDESHDGEPGTAEGFSYQMIYVETDVLDEVTKHQGLPHFRTSSLRSPGLAQQLMLAIKAVQPQETLRAGQLLQDFLSRMTAQHGRIALHSQQPHCDMRAQRMRDYLQAHCADDVSTQDLATVAGVSRVHANRIFNHAYGISPHAYLNALRVLRVKHLITNGESLADAALAAGFADQAHMSRRFLTSVGVSPHRYRTAAKLPAKRSTAFT
jgi:AraC-like DNA-binding protein